MRIGLDLLGSQSPASRGRGIGRYLEHLTKALLAYPSDHEFVLYVRRDLPLPALGLDSTRVSMRPSGQLGSCEERSARLRSNPDRLDVLVIGSPFEYLAEAAAVPEPEGSGPPMAAITYDLIPWLFQRRYLEDRLTWEGYKYRLRHLARFPLLLTISHATRRDAIETLGVAAERVRVIGCASDPAAFYPAAPGPMGAADAATLQALGVTKPFVLSVSGMEPRKNHDGLLKAFSGLPAGLRSSHQIVFAHEIFPPQREHLRTMARQVGAGDEMVIAGRVDDATLRALYQRCSVFALPSEYEGFGLPILEAMLCGAPVIAGNNSSQVEVTGHAAILVEPRDVAAMASALSSLLQSPDLRATHARRGLLQARNFDWDDCAARTLSALGDLAKHRKQEEKRRPARSRRPRIAVFSPLPPEPTGIADYTAELLGQLHGDYAVDVFHGEALAPFLSSTNREVGVYDHRSFGIRQRGVCYDAVVYQMGNSGFHRHVYERLLACPGLVTLHDFGLSGFHLWYSGQPGVTPSHVADEIRYCLGGAADDVLRSMSTWEREEEGLWGAFRRRRIYLNRRLLERSLRVVVHDDWCIAEAARLGLDTKHMTVIPQGGATLRLTPGQRLHVRQAFDLPPNAPLVGVFGIMHPSKLNRETVLAFSQVAATRPDALLLFAGRDIDTRGLRSAIVERRLEERVRFFIDLPMPALRDLVAAVDIGVSLREAPSNGEVSGTLLLLLGAGVPTIVADVDSFAAIPGDIALKIGAEGPLVPALANAMRSLLLDSAMARSLGSRAFSFVERKHSWPRVAALYRAQIEALIADGRRSEGNGRPWMS